ncbi:MAG: 4-hydroxy-tetrahydrodipicolinate synthase [Vampirovibrionales bacterium]|nr:4-hydroxy-tetrahydrodipicolinate synthase [Vampirovibrionales bacterium]
MTNLACPLPPLPLIPAMVTPFGADGSLDLITAKALALHLVTAQRNDALLLNGTTGESPTTTTDEKIALIKGVKAHLAENNATVPIIAGAGTNNTASSIALSQASVAAGADALLIVVPYYNKPSQNGMVAHFSAIADSVPSTPLIIYNIPGRTGVLMQPETMARLHEAYPTIVGVKQSHNDMEAVSTIRRLLPKTFTIWSGDDPLTLPMMANGATGVISVLSHLAGPAIAAMMAAYTAGDVAQAHALHQRLLPLAQQLFTLPNPTIVKTVLARRGVLPTATFRLPMIAVDASEEALIAKLLADLDAFDAWFA